MSESECNTTPVIVFCSVNRPEMLHESVLCAVRQSISCWILISVPETKDVSPATRSLAHVTILTGRRGSSAQRNHALRSIEGRPEAVIFLDDDVELDDCYVERVIETYRAFPDVAIVNGANLAHGIYPAGTLDRDTARQLIAKARSATAATPTEPVPMETAYGCRMSMRGSLLGKIFFDERLPLYSYLEDLDFALLCKQHGKIVENPRALSVHIEVAFGRTNEKRRGYSEIVNPFYIWSKRTGARLSRIILSTCYRTLRNAMTAIRGGDRERFVGNMMGWFDTLKGQGRPEKILEI